MFAIMDRPAETRKRGDSFLRRLRRQAKWIPVLLGTTLCGGHTAAQDTVPLSAQKPAGADRGVLLHVLPEKDLRMAPPAGAIYNFGTADRFLHPVLTHTFTLRNDGKIPVVIDHIQSSCGCTSGLLVSNGKEAVGYTLPPGKEVAIKTAIDMTKLAPGPIKKFLWVMMPGETVPSFAIRLDADIEGVLTFDPPAVEFGRLQAGNTSAQTLSVTLDKRLLDAVGGVRLVSSNPSVQVTPGSTPDSLVPGGDGHSVLRTYTITVSPKATLGVLSGTLSFVPLKSVAVANKSNTRAAAETAATYLGTLTANVTGEVFGKVTARPGTIVFGPVTQGDTTTRRITLVGKTEAALQNLKVSSPSVWVTAKVSVPERSKPDPNAPPQKLPPMMLLEVTLNPKTPAGALQTQLTLTTQDGEQLVLPAFGYITPAVKKQ
jgi:hypothetical protein